MRPASFIATVFLGIIALAHLFGQLGPERTAAVGREYIKAFRAQAEDGLPALSVEACIGLGKA